MVDDVEHGTNYGDTLTPIEDLEKVFHHATGGRGCLYGLDDSVEGRNQCQGRKWYVLF